MNRTQGELLCLLFQLSTIMQKIKKTKWPLLQKNPKLMQGQIYRWTNRQWWFFRTLSRMGLQKGKSLREVVLFYWKKTNKGEMGNPKRKQCDVCFILEWRREQIFQSLTINCIRQFWECIQSSIQFTRALGLSNKTTELKNAFKAQTKKVILPPKWAFFPPLAWKQKYYYFCPHYILRNGWPNLSSN